MDQAERQGRIDLAAAFRLTARLGWHEGVANHFSLALGPDGKSFLMNPNGRHFSTLRASQLLKLEADDPSCLEGPEAPDISAWSIHGTIHRSRPGARCVLHTHMRYATAISALAGGRLECCHQNAARFWDRVAYDDDFNGLAVDDDEGGRIARRLGNNSVLFMAGHGVTAIGDSVAQTFDDLYYLEKACETQVLAQQTGQPLLRIPDDVAELTSRQWRQDFPDLAQRHFTELKSILDAEEPEYAE
jgi:ribulose-5-phosphate 4-epimerase/fuculose-1-phosphate aldolase